MDVLPERLPEAWKSETTSAMAVLAALSGKYGKPLPWRLVRDALDGAFQAHYLERTVDSKPWPCDYGDAQWIKIRVPKFAPPPPLPPPLPSSDVYVAEADLQPSQIQDLAEVMGDLLSAAAGNDLKFHVRIELNGKTPEKVRSEINKLLGEIVKGLNL